MSMNSWLNKLKIELVGDGWFGLLFIAAGLATQVASYLLTDSTALSLVCGMLGIIGVVLYSQKKMSAYVFSFGQLFLYVYLAWQQHLWGEVVENVFYFVTMVGGMFVWLRHYKSTTETSEVETLELSKPWFYAILAATAIIIGGLYMVLRITNDSQPFMDSLTTVPAFVAQILLMLRYRENWLFWAIINVASIALWAIAEDYCLMVQYIFWTINCAYGYHLWKSAK